MTAPSSPDATAPTAAQMREACARYHDARAEEFAGWNPADHAKHIYDAKQLRSLPLPPDASAPTAADVRERLERARNALPRNVASTEHVHAIADAIDALSRLAAENERLRQALGEARWHLDNPRVSQAVPEDSRQHRVAVLERIDAALEGRQS
jgi:hypothetical protein